MEQIIEDMLVDKNFLENLIKYLIVNYSEKNNVNVFNINLDGIFSEDNIFTIKNLNIEDKMR